MPVATNTPIEDVLPIILNKIGKKKTQAVDMRKVHKCLGIDSPFSSWIQRIAGEYKQNVDFIVFLKDDDRHWITKVTKEYYATLNMAIAIIFTEREERQNPYAPELLGYLTYVRKP